MIGHSPRRSNLCTSTLRSSRGGGNWIDHGGTVIGNEVNAGSANSEVIAWPSGRQLERVTLGEHGPGHARVLRRDGHDRLPVAPRSASRQRPTTQAVGLALGRR